MIYKIAAQALLIVLVSSLSQPSHIKAESISESGNVSAVTLYRNQARVTRTLEFAGGEGEQEIVVGELPENIVVDSLFAEADNNVEVRAVQFRTRAVSQSPREDVRELNDKIRANQKEIELNQKLTSLLTKQIQYLDKMENFVAPTATTELSKGVLDAEALERVTNFNFSKREEIAKQEIELSSKLFELQQQANLLNRQLAEISNNASKNVREALLFVRKTDDQKANIRLSYLVNSCGWSPSYSVRATSETNNAEIEYNGLIRQMSGEDWTNVELTLSTATPALSSFGPGLAPFSINLVAGPSQPQMAQVANQPALMVQNMSKMKNIYSQQQQAILAVQNSFNIKDNIGNSWGLNRSVNEIACMQLGVSTNNRDDLSTEVVDDKREPCLSYQLPDRVNLTSRNSQQMVRILQTELPGDFYYVATPVLTNYVFREAELNNDGSADFLAGPINVYLDDRFVGRGEIPTVARGQSFVIGFGADSQLRTRRELVEKKTNINGGNREIAIDYRLVVENYKDVPVEVRVTDRLPKPLKKQDIRVTMVNPNQSLSSDKIYERMERPLGILRWDAEVPARSIGDTVFEIDYSYSLEFDRKYQVALASDQSQEMMQFEEIQAKRIKR